MGRFSSSVLTFQSMLYIMLILQLVKVVMLNTSNTVSLISDKRTLLGVHGFLNEAFGAPFVTDSSGEYRIVKWPLKLHQVSPGDTTLISQCSLSRLHHFLALRTAWNGPISLAVFIESSRSLFIVVNYLLAVQLCEPSAVSDVSIQLVMPLSSLVDCCTEFSNVNCSSFLHAFDKHWAGMTNYDGMVDYPNNLLRNVALDAVISDYVLVVDIDMIPSSGLFSHFREFISKQSVDRRIAFVVPVFEMKEKSEIPADRDALLRMWDQGIIRPFYGKVCWKCQRYTDYEMWHNLTVKPLEQLNIAYMVEWHDPWEPFYIVDQKAPKYDEKFKNYGFNRISQSCEMNIAGYHFAVLDAAFLIHQGFKSIDGFHSDKNIQQNQNRQLYRAFKRTLKKRYPSSKLSC